MNYLVHSSKKDPDQSFNNTVIRAYNAVMIMREAGIDCEIDSINAPNSVTFRLFSVAGIEDRKE